jgi:hypothetical protein
MSTYFRDRCASATLLTTAAGCFAATIAALLPLRTLPAVEVVPAAVARPGGLPIAAAAGTPEEMGAAIGAAFRGEIPQLLRLMGVRTAGLRLLAPAKLKALTGAVPERYRRELTALAAACGVDADDLIAANALVDTQCSALVAPAVGDQPQRVARNMDFFPAAALGSKGTVLLALSATGAHRVVSVGWPGTVGVVSGMNDAGLTANILLNHGGSEHRGGEPILLRIRTLLETAATVDEAVALFAASPVASGHYVLLADGTTSAVVWQTEQGVQRDDARDGWLSCSNGARTAGLAVDERGRTLREFISGTPDDAWMRRCLSATYLKGINAQAMVFTPATRSLDLALGSGTQPAALQAWRRLDLTGLLAGGEPAAVTVADLPRVEPLGHFLDWRGRTGKNH